MRSPQARNKRVITPVLLRNHNFDSRRDRNKRVITPVLLRNHNFDSRRDRKIAKPNKLRQAICMKRGFTLIRRKGFNPRARKGFTLIEVLTTIVIFGVLISITGYVYGVSLQRSRDNTRLSDIATIKNALEQYYLDERSYPHNSFYTISNPNRPWVAKYELERYKTDECDNSDAGKKYVAPNYITSLPEDPRHQMTLTASCSLDATSTPTAGYGQYLYASLVADRSETKPKEYYLIARLERITHVSETVPTVESRYAFSATQIDFQNQGTGWDYLYCAKSSASRAGPTGELCSYNYYVKNSNND